MVDATYIDATVALCAIDNIACRNIRSNAADLNFARLALLDGGILDGDVAIVRQCNSASDGEIVVALIDDSVTLKRFFKESDHVKLMPENKLYEPIIVTNPIILGVVTGLMRRI